MRKIAQLTGLLLLAAIVAAPTAHAQAPAGAPPPANLRLPAAAGSVPAATLLAPEASAWRQVPAAHLALNRTPPLYDTDPPAGLEIAFVDVRVARAEGKLLVHLSWRDPSQDTASLPAAPETPPEQRNRKELTEATERFFDAAAVMFPASRTPGVLSPSLQMGDAANPVSIYYWDAARGAALMEAQGRATTRRTGASFPAGASYRAGAWQVVLELPDLPAGVPLAFAVWNGSQLDRDGRKYFSVWHWLE